MASEPIRDPASDTLLTPKNSTLIIIDHQPVQVNSIASMDRKKLIDNIVGIETIDRTTIDSWEDVTVPAFMDLFIQIGGTAGIQFSYDRE